jgi:hypothetical protein
MHIGHFGMSAANAAKSTPPTAPRDQLLRNLRAR